MISKPGLPAAGTSRVPHRYALHLALLLTIAAAGSPAPGSLAAPASGGRPGHEDRDDRKGEDAGDGLEAPMAAISRAFQARSADPLRGILPPDGKVFVSFDSLGDEAGYFGRDQVYFIFEKVFSQRRTTGFLIRKLQQRDEGESGRRDASRLTHCVGTWSFRRGDGSEDRTQIYFVLSRSRGSWALVQIREAR